jgi:tetratricopeptide (TPR) repeat protein
MAATETAVRVRRHERGWGPYQALLREYLCQRLSLDPAKANDAKLIAEIIAAADSRFAYVTFLADRVEQVSAEDIGALGTGAQLYQRWLAGLDFEYGRKRAEAIRQVVALLAGAEEAHAWVFGSGRKIDPATGSALTPLPEQFEGLEIGLLARLLDLDRPVAAAYDRIDPGLLLTLQTLQGVLWVSRGAGDSRFRLALKEFLPAAKGDPVVGPLLPLMQARMATRALDAVDLLREGKDQDGSVWTLFAPLAPLLEAAVHLSGSEPMRRRWRPEELVLLLRGYDDARENQGFALERVPWLTLIAALGLPLEKQANSDRHKLAAVLQHRGNAKVDGGALAGAITDYDAAITLCEAIRDELGDACPVPLRNDLAVVLQNRGMAKADGGDLAGAITDYDAAITLREAIRGELGDAWPVPLRNDLAGTLQNRGIAKANGGDLADAITDYDTAITLREAIRDELGDAWSVPLRYSFASSLYNRARVKLLKELPLEAGIDVAEGLSVFRPVLTVLGDRCPPSYRDLFDHFVRLKREL